jgi:hypothetical protein
MGILSAVKSLDTLILDRAIAGGNLITGISSAVAGVVMASSSNLDIELAQALAVYVTT